MFLVRRFAILILCVAVARLILVWDDSPWYLIECMKNLWTSMRFLSSMLNIFLWHAEWTLKSWSPQTCKYNIGCWLIIFVPFWISKSLALNSATSANISGISIKDKVMAVLQKKFHFRYWVPSYIRITTVQCSLLILFSNKIKCGHYFCYNMTRLEVVAYSVLTEIYNAMNSA